MTAANVKNYNGSSPGPWTGGAPPICGEIPVPKTGAPVAGDAVCIVPHASVQLMYWPVSTVSGDLCRGNVSTTTMDPTISGKANTYVTLNTTLTSPTVYIAIDGKWGYTSAGVTFANQSRFLIPQSSTAVSSLCGKLGGGYGSPLAMDYADFNYPVPARAYRCQPKCFQSHVKSSWAAMTYTRPDEVIDGRIVVHGSSETVTGESFTTLPPVNLCSTIWDDYRPALAVPQELLHINPVVAMGEGLSCYFTIDSNNAFFDPPKALTQASSAAGPATPDPVAATTTLVSATLSAEPADTSRYSTASSTSVPLAISSSTVSVSTPILETPTGGHETLESSQLSTASPAEATSTSSAMNSQTSDTGPTNSLGTDSPAFSNQGTFATATTAREFDPDQDGTASAPASSLLVSDVPITSNDQSVIATSASDFSSTFATNVQSSSFKPDSSLPAQQPTKTVVQSINIGGIIAGVLDPAASSHNAPVADPDSSTLADNSQEISSTSADAAGILASLLNSVHLTTTAIDTRPSAASSDPQQAVSSAEPDYNSQGRVSSGEQEHVEATPSTANTVGPSPATTGVILTDSSGGQQTAIAEPSAIIFVGYTAIPYGQSTSLEGYGNVVAEPSGLIISQQHLTYSTIEASRSTTMIPIAVTGIILTGSQYDEYTFSIDPAGDLLMATTTILPGHTQSLQDIGNIVVASSGIVISGTTLTYSSLLAPATSDGLVSSRTVAGTTFPEDPSSATLLTLSPATPAETTLLGTTLPTSSRSALAPSSTLIDLPSLVITTGRPVITLGAQQYTADPAEMFSFGESITLSPDAEVTVSGTTISLASGGSYVVINGATKTFAQDPKEYGTSGSTASASSLSVDRTQTGVQPLDSGGPGRPDTVASLAMTLACVHAWPWLVGCVVSLVFLG
ncbi:hypothetical protein LTR56_016978 [Elasticomyces elasticus]|nr:hypothetical protein LTR56_016978 [Elasticomyces elasticus]KAK3636138.1 hypothetical protein LTR22_018896 [Elasticomyces elasticus]KAK5753661.1 hypothetical protein LTS12_016298 [Elasticomyces elasticus]